VGFTDPLSGTLKKHGAIDIRIEALGDEDAVIVIRSEILTLVLEQNVRAAQAAFEPPSDDLVEENARVENEKLDEPGSAEIITLERSERSSTSRA
jgi:hypothetical protein